MQIILSKRENLREDKIEHLTIFWFSFELFARLKAHLGKVVTALFLVSYKC